MPSRHLCSILIPHFNNPSLIQPCLQSLQGLSKNSPPYEVCIIDDGSTDESVSFLKREFPLFRVIQREENGGFIEAVETGITSTEGEILVFLNNDTWVEPDWLLHLADPLIEGKVNGACGSILMDWDGREALFRGVSVNYLGYGFEERGTLPDPDSAMIPVLCPCGGAMAISRDLYATSGGFDRDYGMIYEDLDLGWRLNLLGYDCFLIPSSRAGHRAHASLGRKSFEKKARNYLLNPLRTIFKNWDEEDHLEHIQMAVTLAQARERICLSGQQHPGGLKERLAGLFSRPASAPLVESLVVQEEAARTLASARKNLRSRRKRSTRELFDRFVPHPTRPWFYDEEQRVLLEKGGYWDLEKKLYLRGGMIGRK